jgi:hypothetical protein
VAVDRPLPPFSSRSVAVSNVPDTCRSVPKLCERQLLHSEDAYFVPIPASRGAMAGKQSGGKSSRTAEMA